MSGRQKQSQRAGHGDQRSQMNQQTTSFAAMSLNPSRGPSAVPKTPQAPQRNMTQTNDDVICTNHFPCSFARNLTFYQYDVKLEQFQDRQNRYVDVPGREKCRRVVNDMLLDRKIHPTAVCWYDEDRCLYSTSILMETFPYVYEKETENRRFRLTISSLSATSGTDVLDQSSVRIIETLIKQALKEQFKAIGSVFYRWDGQIDREGPYDLLTGFRQALCLTASGPTLNVDTTITRFYPHADLLSFIWERLLGQQERDFRGRFTDQQYNQIGRRLKGIEVTTTQSDNQTTYVLSGDFSRDLPERIPINPNQSLLDYYRDLGFALTFPNLYCVRGYKFNTPNNVVDLPVELCQLAEWQQVKEDPSINPVPAPNVQVRYRSIMDAVRGCNFADDALFREIQLQVHVDRMMPVPYRTLQPRQFTGNQYTFIDPARIQKMAFLYLADNHKPYAGKIQDDFLKSFKEAVRNQRMQLLSDVPKLQVMADRDLERNLYDLLSQLKQDRCQFVLCLENCYDQKIHELFKQIACGDLGLITQCANFSNIQRIKNLKSYSENLLRSVNAKLSGRNKVVAELNIQIPTIYFGADVLHSKNNRDGQLPSYAAVVASMNTTCSVTNQRVSRQWPTAGRQSEEAILKLKEMVEELLGAFRDNNKGNLPRRVVFYRDGVDDGQMQRVRRDEVEALRAAIKSVYPPNSSQPGVTFVVVKKRHNTRLFQPRGPRVDNVAAGVVVDNTIVHPESMNFFLNSHPPLIGTNKLGHYVLLVDDNNFTVRDLEEMTYSLCHADQRIGTRASESIPSVVHLADAAASKARQMFSNRPRPPNHVRAEILVVHEHMQNAPNMF